MIDGQFVEQLSAADVQANLDGLSDLLLDAVAGGASVYFMADVTRAQAYDFWRDVARSITEHDRLLLVSRKATTQQIVGTVQVAPIPVDNQPHRADIQKMLVLQAERRQGIAENLMQAAEVAARAAGKKLLTLDTANVAAEKLYEKMGYVRVGTIPNFALNPDGSYTGTTYYYKEL
ncbi:MAG: GNAT family N-acetyltransferase [Alphaproteobacteria bacterium]